MRYLLDTNTVIDLINDPVGPVAHRLRQEQPGEVAISAIVAHELYYGAAKSQRAPENLALVDALQFQVLELDRDDARHAGLIRASLAQAGQGIGPYDVLIAGQALARQLVLVTNNRREFDRVDGLTVEDWR